MQENTPQPSRQVAEATPDLLAIAVDHHQSGRVSAAEAAYRKAIEARPDHPETHYNLAVLLRSAGRLLEAEAAYRKVLQLRRDFPEACNNLGNLLKELGRPADAEASYRQALECRADYVEAIYNLGTLLHEGNRLAEAEAAYRQALQLRPDYPEFHNALGNLLYQGGRQDEALACFRQVLALNSSYPSARGMVVECQAWLCQWQGHQQTEQDLLQGVRQGRTQVPPLAFLHYCDDPLAQRQCAEVWARDRFPRQAGDAGGALRHSHDRIRLAYISPDFRSHAVAYLITDLIEQHDRSRFEVFGISIGPDSQDRWRERLQKGFDYFLNLRGESDEAVAQRLTRLELDIAVDLAGYTAHSRTGILASRPAPVQVNYLGFPGSMGAPFIDYLLADRFVIPEAFEPYYTEKVVCLPETFQCSSLRRIAEWTPARRDLGLPETGFVFCCFNSSYKIRPAVFDIWMRLLTRIEGGVLWLVSANEAIRSNLRREAAARGVDPERLLFAPPLPLPEYLARYRQADLFLDTLPYNAGTTASDALWAGLPVLTCAGRSFASRMGGSLLRAANLPELITGSLAAYEAVALRLATQPDELAALRQRLEANRSTHPLFKVDRFRRHIEAAYQRMWDIWRRGGPPISFAVSPIEASDGPNPADTGAAALSSAPPRAASRTFHHHVQTTTEMPKQVLHVGCRPADPAKLPLFFRTPAWREVRLNVDPACALGIVASVTSMAEAATAGFAAVFSSHHLEHLYPHEVPTALKEFHRVLTADGFALISVPDLKSVARLIADDQLEDIAYLSEDGPIAPLDIVYGFRPALARGNFFAAHRTGFTARTLSSALRQAGFAQVSVKRIARFGLWAVACRQARSDDRLASLLTAVSPS